MTNNTFNIFQNRHVQFLNKKKKKNSFDNIGLVVITYRFPIDLSCLFSVVFNYKISDYLI